jgi:hypothetical protein
MAVNYSGKIFYNICTQLFFNLKIMNEIEVEAEAEVQARSLPGVELHQKNIKINGQGTKNGTDSLNIVSTCKFKI